MLRLINSGLLLLVSTTSALKLTYMTSGCSNTNDPNNPNPSSMYGGCANYAAHPNWCDADLGYGNTYCCACQGPD